MSFGTCLFYDTIHDFTVWLRTKSNIILISFEAMVENAYNFVSKDKVCYKLE